MTKISALPTTALPNLQHMIPASYNGATHRLPLAQIKTTLAYTSTDIARGGSTVEAALAALENGKADAGGTTAALLAKADKTYVDAENLRRQYETIGPYYDAALVANAGQDMVFYFATSSSTRNIYMPKPGRIIGARMQLDSQRTAGSVTLRIKKNGINTALFGGAVIINTASDHAEVMSDYANGLPFVAGDAILPNIDASLTWAPTTAQALVWLTFTYDP